MKKKKTNKILITSPFLVIFLILFISFSYGPDIFSTTYDTGENIISDVMEEIKEEKKPQSNIKYVKTPESVKTIYMSACVAGTKNFRNDLVELIEETELNSIIIDIKDFTGTISFDTDNPELLGVSGTGCKSADMKEFVAELHEKGIYVIGRVTVFQDPFFTSIRPDLAVKKESDGSVWEDYKGISFIEVGAKDYWKYILELSKESHKLGFDEINFDYVRFPSDGNMKDIAFPFSKEIIIKDPDNGKAVALEEFFEWLDSGIKDYNDGLDNPMITSADLFGMVTTNKDDLNIGQVLERALPYFDYVAPMVYPSHYPDGFNGWSDPNKYPYELIKFVMEGGVERVEDFLASTSTPESKKERVSTDQLRPWLQDFDYGGNYGPKEVRDQINATYDAGLDSWMLWAASNRYTRAGLNDAE